VAGELFREAAQAATEQKVPLVAIYMTGGARQHENSAALYQMPSLIKAINKFTDSNPDLPVVSVLLGQVWGGVTASSMPRGTVRIAYTGTRMGFAGSRVIKSSRGSTMSLEEIEAAQRAEAHAIKRNVDVLVEDSDELVDVIGGLIGRLKDHAKRDKHPFNEAVLQEQALRPELQKITGREIKVGDKPIISSLRWVRRTEKGTTYVVEPRGEDPKLSEEDRLYERYRNILHDASRPDADMFISYALRDPVQFYNRFVDPKGNIYYPRFIAAIGNIGLQPFLVLGHQASFIKNGDTYSKYPSIPNTNDFRYALRWLKKGMDFKLPLITITDTLGAEASIEAEHGGQFDQIAEFLDIYDRYPAPIISLIPGILGSGGGLTAGTRADAQAMTERALMMVAETRSAASIVYGENPTPKQERLTMLGLGPSSETQLINGLIDRVVPEYPSPYQTVMAMRNYVIETYGSLQSMRTLRRRREERDKNVQAFDTIVSTATIAVD
jgi:acetyl-CoA carboxylase carboxyl transferase subunit beta